jgi:hypothetical protein
MSAARHATTLVALIAVSLLAVPSTGCTTKPRDVPVRITPCDLFPGDLKRLQPHLELTGGCAKLEYSGNQPVGLRFWIEEWRDGEVKRGYHGTGLRGPVNAEVTFTVRESLDEEAKPRLRIVHTFSGPDGSSSFSSFVAKPKIHGGVTSTRKIDGPVDVARGQEATLMGVMYGTGNTSRPEEPIEDLAKRAEFALVFKLSLHPGQD